jgi:hypothetical protein
MNDSFPSQICYLINIYSPFVEIGFEHMFQRLLDNDIRKLQFIGTIGRNKHNKYAKVLFLDLINKFFTFVYIPTINQPYKLLICL